MSKKGTVTTADYLDYQVFKDLIAKLDNDGKHQWSTYCMLSFCLALRASDVRKLKWGDVLNKRMCTVTEKKTQKTKNIPIGIKTMERVSEMYAIAGYPRLGDYIFSSERSQGKPISIQYINRLMKDWKDRYNIPINNFSTHTFRKTFGHYFYEQHENKSQALVELMKIFKHGSVQTTMIYIGLIDDNIYSVLSNIDI